MNNTTAAIFLAALFCSHLSAQERNWPERKAPPAYVRRVSLGVTLSVLPLELVRGRSTSSLTTSPAVDAVYTTASQPRRFGYGVTAQIALTGRFALNGRLLMRRVAYTMNSDILTGTDNTSTTADERIHTVRNEDTRATLFDLPVTVRFFGKNRREAGARWFVEGGGSLRRVTNIKTSRNETVGTAETVFDTTAARPSKRTVHGLVAGVGVQVIDPVGIRVIPEFRYTRWMGNTFNSFSTATRRDQIEGVLSLTF